MGFQPCKMEGVSCKELIVKMGRRLKEQTVDTKTKHKMKNSISEKKHKGAGEMARNPPEGGGRELIPQSVLLTSTLALWHVCLQKHRHAVRCGG